MEAATAVLEGNFSDPCVLGAGKPTWALEVVALGHWTGWVLDAGPWARGGAGRTEPTPGCTAGIMSVRVGPTVPSQGCVSVCPQKKVTAQLSMSFPAALTRIHNVKGAKLRAI